MHTHCGFPIKAAQDMAHGLDLKDSDTIYWVTDMGWMMGPWEVFGSTLLGATMLFYDGALDYPGPDRLWSLVEHHAVTVLGVSPTLVRTLMRHGDEPLESHDLSSLRFWVPRRALNPEPWRWFLKKRQETLADHQLFGRHRNLRGILMGNVLHADQACSLPPRAGMAAMSSTIKGAVAQSGRRACRAPALVGMTRGFGETRALHATYWSLSQRLGAWRLAAIDQDGLWYIMGRSDDTIKSLASASARLKSNPSWSIILP